MLKNSKNALVLALALLFPATIQAQNASQLNLSEVQNLYDALRAETRDLDNS